MARRARRRPPVTSDVLYGYTSGRRPSDRITVEVQLLIDAADVLARLERQHWQCPAALQAAKTFSDAVTRLGSTFNAMTKVPRPPRERR